MTRSAGRDIASRVIPGYLCWSSLLVCLWVSLTAAGWAQVPEKPPFVQPPSKPPVAQPPTKPPVAQPPAKPGVTEPPKTPAAKPPAAKTPAAKPKEEGKPPEPVSMSLWTRDGWQLHCMYYPPQENIRSGRETVPIILVHGWGGQGSEWNSLAVYLQTLGHASVIVDLRGHGRSTTRRVARDPTGKTETVGFDDLKKPDELSRLWMDLEAAKGELRKKNDAGEVNLEMLTVIAAEEGCIVALEWAVRDWSWKPTLQGRQGQDVQALILLSPIESFRRMSASRALNHDIIRKRLSLLFIMGEEDSKFASSVQRLHDRIEKIRPPLSKDDPAEAARLRDLYLLRAPTSLQGTSLTDPSLPVNRAIEFFINRRLIERREQLAWWQRGKS